MKNINFIVLNDSFDTIKDIDQIDLIFLDVDLNFEMNGIDIGAYLKSKFPKIIIVFVSMHEDFVFPALSIGFFQFIRKTKYDFDIVKVLKQIEDYLKENLKKICIKMDGRSYVVRLKRYKNIIMSIGHDLYIITDTEGIFDIFIFKKIYVDQISFG